MFDGVAPSRISICRQNWKFFVKLVILRNFSAYWVNGQISKQYLKRCFGIDTKKIFNQYLTVDSTSYKNKIFQKISIKDEIKETLNITSSEKVILYSGRFIERKRVSDIIEAIGKIQTENKNLMLTLLLIGDIDTERISIYKSLCEDYNVTSVFGGFIEQSELYRYYFASDLLILPSEDEPWGLVVNEAIYSQIPILVSNDCGSALDLVIEKENGYIFECGNIDDLASKILMALSLDDNKVSETSRKLSQSWNFDNSIFELNKALQYVFKK
jgi:glycosyltransferase involved in cell wall biosynthesis